MQAEAADEARRGLDGRFQEAFRHRVHFTRHVVDAANPLLDMIITGSGAGSPEVDARSVRGLLIVDSGLHAAQPGWSEQLHRRLAATGLALESPALILPGGEAVKDGLGRIHDIIRAIDEAHICRHSYVVVAGGGAVLDAVGFAAATTHRGVRLVRLPSTTLAQDDAGIGIKNGVNLFGKKNLMGVFDVPWAVINDSELPASLSLRDWRAGFSEAVKVALLKDSSFFDQIEQTASRIAARERHASEPVIRRSAALHFAHIVDGGDPFERDRARPLDFGHWSAHRLEVMTGHRLLHGEAVAIGIALDCRYAVHAGYLPEADADRILAVLEALGFALFHPVMNDFAGLIEGAEEFREHLGGTLAITMLRTIGNPFEIDLLDHALVRSAVDDLRRRSASISSGARAG